mgnify:CR=1 FL=1
MALFVNSSHITDTDYSIGLIEGHRWYPVYCRPNKERKFIEQMIHSGISCYLPEMPRHRMTRGERITTQVPMFIGYAFVCVTREENWSVKKSLHILRMLPVDESNEKVLVSELNMVRLFEKLSKRQDVEIRPELIPGKQVEITQGALRGLTGVVKKRKNKIEVIVSLNFLGCSLMTVEVNDLEVVE